MFGDSKTRLTMPVKEQADVEDDLEGATVYSDDELALIESCFKSEDGNLLTAFYLGIYCGLRISECFALRWENINWEEGTITVNRQLTLWRTLTAWAEEPNTPNDRTDLQRGPFRFICR